MRLLPLCALTTCALAAPRGRGGTPTKPSTSERQRRLYDRGCLFSPEGRVYQVEYAEKNVARGSFAVGAVAPDGVALAAARSAHARSVPGAFLERRWRERVHRVDDTIAGVACGLVPDALRSSRPCATSAEAPQQGEAPPVEACARHGRPAPARRGGGAALRRAFSSAASTRARRAAALRDGPSGAYEAYGGRRSTAMPATGRPSRTWSAPPRLLAAVGDGADATCAPRGRGGVAADGPERRRRDGRRARRAAALGLRDLRRGRARRALREAFFSSNGVMSKSQQTN